MKYNMLRKEEIRHEQNKRIAERTKYHSCRVG